MSFATLDALYEAAVAALEAGDYAAAIAKAQAARLRIATAASSARSSAGGSTSFAWPNVAAIDRFIADCYRSQALARSATAGPFQVTKIRTVRPGY